MIARYNIHYVHSFNMQLKKGGETTEDVDVITPYLTAHPHNVTLMEKTPAATMSHSRENVET